MSYHISFSKEPFGISALIISVLQMKKLYQKARSLLQSHITCQQQFQVLNLELSTSSALYILKKIVLGDSKSVGQGGSWKREVSSSGDLTRCCITDSVELNFAEPGRMSSVKRRLMMVKLRVKGTRAKPATAVGRGRKGHASSQCQTRCGAKGDWDTTPACLEIPYHLRDIREEVLMSEASYGYYFLLI